MKKNKFTIKIIITVSISIAIIIAIFYFAILPASNSIITTKEDITKLRLDVEKKYFEGQNLRKISEGLKIIENKIPKLNSVFIKKTDAVEFITTLENIALKTNVKQRMNLTDKKGGEYQINTLDLLTNGDFISQMNYLAKIESLNYAINITSLELLKSSQGKNISMHIFSNTYWINE